MEGRLGTTLLLHDVPGVPCERVLAGRTRPADEFGDKQYREAVRAAAGALAQTGAADAALHLPSSPSANATRRGKSQAVATARAAAYRFDRMKSKPEAAKLRHSRASICYVGERGNQKRATAGTGSTDSHVAHGVALARDLGNLPPTSARQLPRRAGTRTGQALPHEGEVLERADMEKLGMGALLSVARGSVPAAEADRRSNTAAARRQKPVVLVGKGVTFDTGGISLKPAPEMDEMKFDMCGAASVLGT
jgi:leucyl aminopeptidase